MASLALLYTFALILTYNAIFCEHSLWSDKNMDRASASSENDPEHFLPYIRGEKPIATTELKADKNQDMIKKIKEVKEAEVFLGQMLRVLQQYFASKLPQDKGAHTTGSDRQPSGHQNIAWSYYDDLGK